MTILSVVYDTHIYPRMLHDFAFPYSTLFRDVQHRIVGCCAWYKRKTVEIWSESSKICTTWMSIQTTTKMILWKFCSRKFMRPLHSYTIAEKSVKEKDRTGPKKNLSLSFRRTEWDGDMIESNQNDCWNLCEHLKKFFAKFNKDEKKKYQNFLWFCYKTF
jgi:hypothetical protein